ncbi:sigma-70 family RNA polymerase sigma factor [Chryseomicrobium palamuruense]
MTRSPSTPPAEGTDQWLNTLMTTYGDALTNLSYSYLHDWGKAQEVAQDVFLKCYENADSLRKLEYIKPYLYRMTINKCKDVLKSSWIRRVIFGSKVPEIRTSSSASVEETVASHAASSQLIQHVAALPVNYREVIHLHYYEELPVSEVAVVTQLNENTVKTRLRRARTLLGKSLQGGDSLD